MITILKLVLFTETPNRWHNLGYPYQNLQSTLNKKIPSPSPLHRGFVSVYLPAHS
jgi:hypothetical protein